MRRVARAMFVAAVLGLSVFGVVGSSAAGVGQWWYLSEEQFCSVRCSSGVRANSWEPSACDCKAFCEWVCNEPCIPTAC